MVVSKNVTFENQEFDVPTLSYSIPSQSKMKLALLKRQFMMDDEGKPYWNKTINFWQMYANPNAIGYNDYEVLLGIKRTAYNNLYLYEC